MECPVATFGASDLWWNGRKRGLASQSSGDTLQDQRLDSPRALPSHHPEFLWIKSSFLRSGSSGHLQVTGLAIHITESLLRAPGGGENKYLPTAPAALSASLPLFPDAERPGTLMLGCGAHGQASQKMRGEREMPSGYTGGVWCPGSRGRLGWGDSVPAPFMVSPEKSY